MSYFRFKEGDIINTFIKAHPRFDVELNGDQVTGSIFLERKFLNDDLLTRRFQGFSDKEGGFTEKDGPFSSSVDIVDAELDATNKQFYKSLLQLYDFYSIVNIDYTPNFTGSETTRFRVVTIPAVYYDRQILTGSFTASDLDSSGDERILYDNGRGGIYSGSLSGTIVGNIFYNEGFVVLKGGGLNDEASGEDFGEVSPTNFKWRMNFKGTHNIPVKIFRCRAPAGQLNCSTNPSFYYIPTGSQDDFRNEKVAIQDKPTPFVTRIGLYNEDYELVGVANLAQAVKKDESSDILFRVRLDF